MKFSEYFDFPALQEKRGPKYTRVNSDNARRHVASTCSRCEIGDADPSLAYALPSHPRACMTTRKSNICVMLITCIVTAAATLFGATWFQLSACNSQLQESYLDNPVFGQRLVTQMKWEEDERFVNFDPYDGRWDSAVGAEGQHTAWDDIYAGAWVEISDPAKYGLSGGVPMAKYLKSGISPDSEAFVVSMLHQLHCVGELKHGLVEVAQGKNISKPEHTTHCIEYLRHAVLCNADLTLEKPQWLGDDDFKGSSGWGATHQCRDWSIIKTFPRPDFFN